MKSNSSSIRPVRTHRVRPVIWSLLIFFLFSGCGWTARGREEADGYIRDLLTRLDHSRSVGETETLGVGPYDWTFRRACARSADVDPKVMDLLDQLAAKKIDVEEAGSYLWPRLEVKVQADVPLSDDSNGSDDNLTGGLYLRMDIWKSIFSSDEAEFRRAEAKRVVDETRLALDLLTEKVFLRMVELDVRRRQTDIREKMSAAAQKGWELAEIYADLERIDAAEVWRWRFRVQTEEAGSAEARRRRDQASAALGDVLGVQRGDEVRIVDADGVIDESSPEIQTAREPSDIWDRRTEARVAEAELLAAEVAVDTVWTNRLPKLGASVGYGKIPVGNQGDTSEFAVMFDLTLPIFDFGDQRRRKERAILKRKAVRRRVESLAFQLWREADNAAGDLAEAERADGMARENLERLTSQEDLNQRLLTEERLDQLVYQSYVLERLQAELNAEEARLNLHRARAAYRWAFGLELRPGQSKALLGDLTGTQRPDPADQPEKAE